MAWLAARFGLAGAKWIVYGFIALAIVTIISLAYWHYTGLLDEIVELEKDKTRLELEVGAETKAKEAAIANALEWQDQSKRQIEALNASTAVQSAATEQMRRLNDVLSKHDLKAVASKKPKLVEDRLNSGTSSALRMLGEASDLARRAGPPQAP